jgi:hypothetical protein
MGATGHTASCQPPGAYLHCLAWEPLDSRSSSPAGEVRRTHANKVTLRLTTGATGHDEGNDMLIHAVNSCTRAPSVSKRRWIVAIVAAAQGGSFPPRGGRSRGTHRRPNAKTSGMDSLQSDDTTCDPTSRRVGDPCSRFPRGPAHSTCVARAPGGGPAPYPSRPSACSRLGRTPQP